MSTTWNGTGEVVYDDAVVAHVEFAFEHEAIPHQHGAARPPKGRESGWRGWLSLVDGTLTPAGSGRSPQLTLRAEDGWHAPFTVERGRHVGATHRLRAQLTRSPEPAAEEGETSAAPTPEADDAAAEEPQGA